MNWASSLWIRVAAGAVTMATKTIEASLGFKAGFIMLTTLPDLERYGTLCRACPKSFNCSPQSVVVLLMLCHYGPTLNKIEYGVYGDLLIIYPKPYSIYLRGIIERCYTTLEPATILRRERSKFQTDRRTWKRENGNPSYWDNGQEHGNYNITYYIRVILGS